MLKIRMDLPEREEELNLAERMLGDQAPELVLNRGDVNMVIREGDLHRLRDALTQVLATLSISFTGLLWHRPVGAPTSIPRQHAA